MSLCSNPKCGRPISYIGACGECFEKEADRAHWVSMGKALNSVPLDYQWAKWGSDVLYQRCPGILDLGEVTPVELMSSKFTVIYGESGAGKTSLATALFHWIVYSTSPASNESIMVQAQGARFVDASDVFPSPTHEGVPVAVKARRATILLLDDACSEGGAGDSYAAQAKFAAVSELLRYRDKEGLPTIITTPGVAGDTEALQANWTARYGGGIMRRFLLSEKTRVIPLKLKVKR